MHAPFAAVPQAFRPVQGGQSEADEEEPERVEANTWHTLSGIFRCGTFYQPGTRETKCIIHTIPYTKTDTYTMASTSALSNSKVSELQQSGDFSIKSESVTPKLGKFGHKSLEIES